MKADSTSAKKRVTLELTAPVALIQFGHPPVNVFDLQMIDEISDTMQSVESHSEVVAVVFGGSRRAFSAVWTRSHIIANSAPPPRHMPLTSAIVTLGYFTSLAISA